MDDLELNIDDLKLNPEDFNIHLDELDINLEHDDIKLEEQHIYSPFDNIDISKLRGKELEEYSKVLDLLIERKAKGIALDMALNGSTKNQKQAIRALAKNKGIRVKRTKKRRFNGKTELVTPEEKEAFKIILDTEGIDISDDTFEGLFE